MLNFVESALATNEVEHGTNGFRRVGVVPGIEAFEGSNFFLRMINRFLAFQVAVDAVSRFITVADGNGGSTTRELAADEYELLGFDSSKASDKVTVTVQSVADSTKTATFTVKVVADETPTPDPDLATEEELKQLEDAIAKAEAEKLNQDDYTADSWKAYANALAQAKKVLAKENAISTEVQDAIRHLTEARKALVKVSADGKKPGAVISDTGAAVFGVAGAVVVLAAAGIALTIWRKRRI